MSKMWTRRVCPALLCLGSLILFLCTLAPTVTFVDSGELIVTANNLGVAHPPGFPLYLLIAHCATWLPIGSVAQRVHFASALGAAIAVSLLYLVTAEMILLFQSRAPKPSPGKTRVPEKQHSPPEFLLCIPGLVAAGMAAFSRTLWSYATVAEVYTLNALFILLVFLLTLRWRNRFMRSNTSRGSSAQPIKSGGPDKRERKPPAIPPGTEEGWGNGVFYLAAFVFGLALGGHHVTVALTLPACLWLIYATKGTRFLRSRYMLAAALAFLAGIAVYAYLPLAAARSPILNWGNPDTLARFWTHVTGGQYQSNFSFSPDQVRQEVSSFVGLVFREFGWPWLPLGLVLSGIGFYALRKDRILLVFLVLIIGFNLLFGMGYEIAEDKDAYYLPIFLALAIAAGLGTHAILAARKIGRGGLAAGMLLLVPVLAFACNFRINNRRNYYVAEDYIGNIFSTMRPDSLLITGDWQVASPMLYFQEIERRRTDVVCIDVLLLKRSWYYGYLESKYPALMNRTRDSVRLFMEDLLRWEKDPDAYQRDPQLNQRIDARYCSMINALARNHFAGGPVYATEDVVLNSGGENKTLAQSLLASYQIVPQGLVFQLFADRGVHRTELPELRVRGLIDRLPAVLEDPVVRRKVLPVYATMLVNCGRAFNVQGDSKRALDAYRQAWALDSEFVRARALLPPGVTF